jgi:hypothetical protein
MQHEREQVQSMRPNKKMKTAPDAGGAGGAGGAAGGATAEFGFWGGLAQEMVVDGPLLPSLVVPAVPVAQMRQ